jgi:aprataxin
MKNMPTLKTHLQEEWDRRAKHEKAKMERKRKLDKYLIASKDDDQSKKQRKNDEDGDAVRGN